MKKIIYSIALLFAVAILAAGVFAVNTNNQTICQVSHLFMSNPAGPQNPKFTCCNSWGYCMWGDHLQKHLTLMAAPDYMAANPNWTFDGEAAINVYNYQMMDNTNIVLRINHLFPAGGIFSAWLVDDNDQTQNVMLGMFSTNYMGRGILVFQQNLDDINKFDGIQIKDMDGNLASSTTLMFNMSSPIGTQTFPVKQMKPCDNESNEMNDTDSNTSI